MKKLIAVTSLLFLAVAANAATVHYSSPGIVTAIGDLNIGGVLYNVDFEAVGSEYSTYGGTVQFWLTGVDVGAAGAAVNAILNLEGPETQVKNAFPDDYAIVGEGLEYWFTNNPGTGFVACTDIVCGLDNPLATYPTYSEGLETSWSVAAVPVPAAVWLFGSGLGLLGFARRNRT
jgi:hypothetical protein